MNVLVIKPDPTPLVVYDDDPGSERNVPVEEFDVLIPHTDAAGAGRLPDLPGPIGAVYAVFIAISDAKSHPSGSQRVIGMAPRDFLLKVKRLVHLGYNPEFTDGSQVSPARCNGKAIQGIAIHNDDQPMAFLVNDDKQILLRFNLNSCAAR